MTIQLVMTSVMNCFAESQISGHSQFLIPLFVRIVVEINKGEEVHVLCGYVPHDIEKPQKKRYEKKRDKRKRETTPANPESQLQSHHPSLLTLLDIRLTPQLTGYDFCNKLLCRGVESRIVRNFQFALCIGVIVKVDKRKIIHTVSRYVRDDVQ